MAINKNVFIHPLDKAALQALKAIPGFTYVMKAFMKIWDEKQWHLTNMSTNIKLSEEQLPNYYRMLPPICEKLGIEVPDLFLELDVIPNAYTAGDSNPFIVITSGLIETLPEELIPTVLAHECGHIACHHVLYRTMATYILNGALNFVLPADIAKYAILPIESAFAYWMRCSEFSADRAAILCDGNSDKVIEMCMRFAGFDKDIPYAMNLEAFMNQAKQYESMVDNNAYNKAMELLMFRNYSHPINAVRAYEAKRWEDAEDFIKAKKYFETYKKDEKPTEFPISFNEKHFLGRAVEDVENELYEMGFEDVDLIRSVEKSLFSKSGTVTNVDIKGSDNYKDGDWVSVDSKVDITFYLPLTNDEIAAMHPGEIKLPHSLKVLIGKPYIEVEEQLRNIGFENIFIDEIKDITKENDKNLNKVASITIDKSPKYEKGDWVDSQSIIEITYHSKI